MSLLEKFQHYIIKEDIFQPKDKLLIAVSGGVDSVVLCELCKQSGLDFEMAHCNFQLRDEESDGDETFVRKLAEKYEAKIHVKKFDTEKYATGNKVSIQVAARELRYAWFKELMDNPVNKIKYLLTAHHADDNVETVLMNFCRGTGLHGLTGIPEKGNSGMLKYLRRPLLSFSKKEILRFAKENKLDFVEDSSNQSDKYTRNLFRNEIIPAISKAYPQVKENLINNIARFKEIEKIFPFM